MADAKIILSAEDKTGAAIASARASLQSMRPHIEAASLAMFGFSTVAGAAAASLAAFTASVRAIDSFNDLADATGASVENISALDRVARETGGNFDTISTSLIKFNAALKNTDGKDSAAAAALQAIGLSAKDLKNQDPAEALRQTAVALAGFADDGNKARLVQELFGKSLKEVAPYLKDLAEQGSLVAGVTTDQAQAAETFNKQLFKLKANSEDAARAMTSSLVPALNQVLEAFNNKGFKAGVDQFGETVFGWTSNAQRKQIAMIGTEISDLQNKLKGTTNYQTQSGIAQQIDAKVAQLTELKKAYFKITDGSTGGGRGSQGIVAGGIRNSVDFTMPDKEAAAKAIALAKQQDGAVQSLSEKLLGLNDNTSEYEKTVGRLTTGAWKDFDANTKIALKTIASVIDETQVAANQTKLSEAATNDERERARKTQLEYSQAAVEGMLAVSDYAEAIALQNEEYALEIALMGKSESARRIALADRQIELNMKSQILAIDKNIGLTEDQREAERKRVREAADAAKAGVFDLVSKQDANAQSPMAGFQAGLQEYQKSVADVAANTKDLMVNAFKGMEDALVDFVKSGKLDFRSLADSIISDLIRIELRRSVMGPLAGGIQSLFGFADGGIMTSGGPLPLHKYANGGVASSPQLAVFGEGRMNEAFVPLPDGRSIPVNLSGDTGGSITVNQPIVINAPNASAQTVAQIQAMMPGLIATNAKVVEGVIRQAMARKGGRLTP